MYCICRTTLKKINYFKTFTCQWTKLHLGVIKKPIINIYCLITQLMSPIVISPYNETKENEKQYIFKMINFFFVLL